MKVIAHQGDTLDLVCWRYYQRSEPGLVEQVLALNPHLADDGPILEHGAVVILPDIKPAALSKKMVHLWD